MKKVIIFAFLLTVIQTLQARERTRSEMVKSALSVLQYGGTGDRKLAASSNSLNILQQDASLTVMGNDALGFAVLSNDDAWPAVIGYSSETFHPETNDGLRWFLTVAAQSMSRDKQYEPVVPTGDFKPTVAPIVQTLWNQTAPYNDQCPPDKGGTLCPTGCVATALAQIMYYWKYPVHGTGQGSVSVTSDGSGNSIFVDFGAATYDWDNMLLDYETTDYTDTQANAVSTLMLHCGVAVDMKYDATGSGAYTHEARYGMIHYFNYNPGINMLTRNYYSTTEWMKIIYEELNAGRPVYYTGVDASQGGHAFVCDGYDASGYLHINWGWGAKGGNGYYDVALLDPSGYSFSNSQDMLVGIAPTQVMDYASHIISNQEFTATRINKALLNVNAGSMYNLTGESFTGEIAVLMDMGDSMKVLKSVAANNITNYYTVGTLNGMVRLQISELEDGTYRVFVGSKSVKDNDWQLVRRAEGQANSYWLVVSNGDYTLSSVTDDSWATSIGGVKVSKSQVNEGVYGLDGRYLGSDINRLGKGLYIVNGKKVMKR